MFRATSHFVSLSMLTVGLMIASPALAVMVPLQNGTATGTQGGFTPRTTYDGVTSGGLGWAIGAGNSLSPQTIVWEAVNDVSNAPGTQFTFNIYMQYGANLTIGQFRVSATTDARTNFADSVDATNSTVANGGDVTANWTTLAPLTVTDNSPGGATFTINGDNSVTVSGANPSVNTYVVTANTVLTGITGFRLEAMPSAANLNDLGSGPVPTDGRPGPGAGNFELDEFSVDAVALPEPASLGLLSMTGLLALRRRK